MRNYEYKGQIFLIKKDYGNILVLYRKKPIKMYSNLIIDTFIVKKNQRQLTLF